MRANRPVKLVTFRTPGAARPLAGWLAGTESGGLGAAGDPAACAIDAAAAQRWLRAHRGYTGRVELAGTMESLITAPLALLHEIRDRLGDARPAAVAYPLPQAQLLAPLPQPLPQAQVLAPLPQPRTVRDFYAFEAHVKAARARRGLAMIPEWYALPVFYFSNPNAVYGPAAEVPYPSATRALDFELEVAAVIGRGGRDIPAERADEHIAGFTIMNDWSARDVQREEMKVGLGPAKGKDFATSLGPWLATPDELADRREPAGPPGAGWRYRLEMTASVDGREISRGNLADLYWTFAQMVAYASRDCSLYPGEVIGSGTVGTGCLLELGLPWLQPGQTVTLAVERLGVLQNTVGRIPDEGPPGQARA